MTPPERRRMPEAITIDIDLHTGNETLGEVGYRDRFLLTAITDLPRWCYRRDRRSALRGRVWCDCN